MADHAMTRKEGKGREDVPGVKKKATFENKSAGVKRDTFRRLIC